MNTHPIHAERTAPERLQEKVLKLLKRWMGRQALPHGSPARTTEPASWPECVGRPYVIGPGTLLVMSYMRTRLPRVDPQRAPSTSSPD